MGTLCGLSYTEIQGGCPPWYQIFQASPQIPAGLLRPHLPTTAVFVRPSRAGRPRDFHPFDIYRVGVVTHAPVSTSPNIVFSRYGPVGSQKGGQRAATCEGVEAGNHTPQRSSYAAPALLEACGSRQCPRTRLATVEAGFPAGVDPGGARIGVTVCVCGGWRPPQQTHPGVCGVASPLLA